MLPLAFFLAMSCAELRDTEQRLAVREFEVTERLEAKREPEWALDALEKEFLLIRGTLDDVDTAVKKKGCP